MEMKLHSYFAVNRVRGEWFSEGVLEVLRDKLTDYVE